MNAPADLVLEVTSTPDSVRSVRDRLRSWLFELDITPTHIFDLLLATGELVNNAVEHPGRPRDPRIDVTARLVEGDMVVITVSDHGQWKHEPSHPDRGLGLTIVDAFVDERTTASDPSGTTVRIRKRLAEHAHD